MGIPGSLPHIKEPIDVLALRRGRGFRRDLVWFEPEHFPTLFDGLQIEFKQLFFSNGYVAASVAEASAIAPVTNPRGRTRAAGIIANPLEQGPAPTPPPLPQVGPPKGPIIAASLGGMADLIVAGILVGHHHLHEEPRDFDTGFQSEMVLKTPLTLDRARVAASLNRSSVN